MLGPDVETEEDVRIKGGVVRCSRREIERRWFYVRRVDVCRAEPMDLGNAALR
jgi:hypothetical protein